MDKEDQERFDKAMAEAEIELGIAGNGEQPQQESEPVEDVIASKNEQHQAEQPQQTKWRVYTEAEARTDRPPRESLVEGILGKGDVLMLYGKPKSYKSMAAYDMAAAVVAGDDWLPGLYGDGIGLSTQPCNVLIVDIDQGTRATLARIDAVTAKRGPQEHQIYSAPMPVPALIATSSEAIQELRANIERYDIGMVIIDNLGRISGGIEENSQKMADVIGPLRQIADDMNVAIVVIHHSRKDDDTFKGSVNILAAVDMNLLVKKDGLMMTLICKEYRHGESGWKHDARWRYTHKVLTSPHSEPELETAYFVGLQSQDAPTRYSMVVVAMVNVLEANGGRYEGKESFVVAVGNHLRTELEETMSSREMRKHINKALKDEEKIVVEQITRQKIAIVIDVEYVAKPLADGLQVVEQPQDKKS